MLTRTWGSRTRTKDLSSWKSRTFDLSCNKHKSFKGTGVVRMLCINAIPGATENAWTDTARPSKLWRLKSRDGQRGTILQGWASRDLFQCSSRFSLQVYVCSSRYIWDAHRIKVFSSISFCFSYSYVRQTKLASSLVNVWAHYKIVIDWLINVPIDNWHTHSTRFTEPRMSARRQCEASTWRHEAHFTTIVRGCSRGCRCRFRRPWSCRCWHGRLPVLVFVLAAATTAAVVVHRL